MRFDRQIDETMHSDADTQNGSPSDPSGEEGTTNLHHEQISVTAQEDPSPDQDDFEPNLELGDEESALKNLTENVRDQDDIERDITHQANLALIDAEDKRDEKRIEKAQANVAKLQAQKKTQDERFSKAIGKPDVKTKIKEEIARINSDIELNDQAIADFRARIEERHKPGEQDEVVRGGTNKLPNESHRDFLIRTGKITPFAKIGGPRPPGAEGGLASALLDAEDQAIAEELEEKSGHEPRSHQNLRAPGFAEDTDPVSTGVESEFSLRPRKKRRVRQNEASEDEYTPGAAESSISTAGFVVSEESDDYDMTDRPRKKPSKVAKKSKSDAKQDLGNIDDGNEANYQKRLADWVERRSRARKKRMQASQSGATTEEDDGVPEWFKPSPDEPDHEFDDGLKLPGDIYPALFDYQKTGVQWLAELYKQKVGGIIGDEMGLGKTVQLIAFVAALHYSKLLDKPVIVVAPATVLRQWVNEFHRWWPALRVSILHSSGSGMLNIRNEDRIEDKEVSLDQVDSSQGSSKAARRIVNRVVKHGHVLVTTYAGLQTYGDILIPVHWGYAVLDEGHKIRNPNTAITIYCKELRTPNRVILSGTPMQNNLMELWSLFDFVFPMRLGTLVDFRTQFEVPIRAGGHGNASNLDIVTAQKCAETLKDTISPYLIQRLKVDVAADLPKKSEQVLFCKLTQQQRDKYEIFLRSEEMNAILKKDRQSLFGIDILRKICNHPDLVDPKLRHRAGYRWGMANKSGKMQVVKALLQMWKRMGNKTLLFSQGVQMLDILQEFVGRMDGIRFLRMDGTTSIKDRQTLVDRFNKDPDIDLFLLTTKVGGLGVNLTGANRVIIFDPDWNPSTDVQARERAWRLGQKKEVTIYRLMTAGTIEEKIYHRQIYKQFLANKVMKDPTQRTTLELQDLYDLFTLGSPEDDTTKTGKMFGDAQINLNDAKKERTDQKPAALPSPVRGDTAQNNGSEDGDREEELRNIAGVAGLEQFQQGQGVPGLEDPQDEPEDEHDARIMQNLLASSGVHSALEHDQIVNDKKRPQPTMDMLQREANRKASAAAASLRRAGEQARNIPIGTVTWTGQFGEGGRSQASSNVRRGRGAGPGSAGILAGIANRQGLNNGGGNASSAERAVATTSITASRRRDFEQMIPDYIRRYGGKVPSQSLVEHFNRQCVTTRHRSEFVEVLNRVAETEETAGRGGLRTLWKLKRP